MSYPTACPLKVEIGGVDRTSKVALDTLQITQVIGSQIDTCSFVLRDAGGLGIQELDEVIISPLEVEDETGASWGPLYHGLGADSGNAFLRVQGLDLSPWAGIEGQSTPYRLVLWDPVGKTAKGYIGNADEAEELGLGSEMLSNTGFETAGGGGADIWANWDEYPGDGALADETTLVHSGNHAAKLTAGSAQNTYMLQIFTLVPGVLYAWSFWTRGDGTYGGSYSLRDRISDLEIIPRTNTGVAGTTYAQVSGSFVAPSGCVSAHFVFACSQTATGVAYFDDMSIKQMDLVTNGDMELDSSWSNWGTPTVNERSSAQAHGGTYSRKFTVDAVDEGIQGVPFTTSTLALYKVSAWIYPDDGTKANLSVRQGNDAVWSLNENLTLVQDQWNEVTFYYTEPAGGAGAYVRFTGWDQTSGSWYIDDVSIREVLHVGTEGVHIVYGPASVSRDWTSFGPGFDFNGSTYWLEIWPANLYGKRHFAGYITIAQKRARGPILDLEITCEDYTLRLDKVIVNAEYTATSDRNIIVDVFATYLPVIWTGMVYELLTAAQLPLITFNRLTLCQMMNMLAEKSGAQWYVDYGPVAGYLASLHYMAPETSVAPYSISDSPDLVLSFPCEALTVTRDATDHINVITVVGGDYLSADTDFFYGADGTQTIILLDYEFEGPDGYTKPRVYKNVGSDESPSWSEQTVGLEYVDDPADYNVLFNKLQKHLVFATAPSWLDLSVKVTARYEIPLRQRLHYQPSYDLYGMWLEDVIVDSDIVDLQVAKERAKQEIDRRAVVDLIQCVVREPGLVVGQRLGVVNTPMGIQGYCNVQKIVTRFLGGGRASYDLEGQGLRKELRQE